MSALGKFMAKYGNQAKGVLGKGKNAARDIVMGAEVAGPAGAFKRSGYADADGPIMRPRFDGAERDGGIAQLLEKLGIGEGLGKAKEFATKSPLHAGLTGAGAGAAGMALGDAMSGDDGDEDEDDELAELRKRLGV